MWLAAWKLVSNDAKRTVAPPNAKHSTLPQGCFFMFLFLTPFTIRQQYNHCPTNFPLNRDMPLACFQCADTLLFAAKHANGMALRYGVIERF